MAHGVVPTPEIQSGGLVGSYVIIAMKRWKTKYISLPYPNVPNRKWKFSMNIFIRVTLSFIISLTSTSVFFVITVQVKLLS